MKGSRSRPPGLLHHPCRSSLIPLPSAVPQHLREPGEDGYRTPIIEDPEHPAHKQNHQRPSNRRSVSQATSRFFHDLYHGEPTPSRDDPPPSMVEVKPSSSGSTNLEDTDNRQRRLSWKQRMQHVTWAYFTLTMATGGIANVLSAVPFRFNGLRAIGLIFFFLNLVLYVLIWAMILTRFIFYPHTFRASFTHPTESLFVPAFAVSFGTILITIVEYGFGEVGTWLNHAVLVLFWFDTALAVILSITIYLILWSTQSFTIARMTPIWIFPAYPLLIIGPHAANLSSRLGSATDTLRVIIGGFTIQGIGFLVSLTIYSAFVYRLMTQKLPAESLRPGMFVSVGPSAFTVSGIIGMAANLPKALARSPVDRYMDVPVALAADILKVVANWCSLWLWGLAFWFFFVSLAANLTPLRDKKHRRENAPPFVMTWFSFIFPQTALTSATLKVGEAFAADAIQWVGCVMAALLVLAWFFVVYMMLRAVVLKQILWPEKGEDRTEGGFQRKMDMEVVGSQKGAQEDLEAQHLHRRQQQQRQVWRSQHDVRPRQRIPPRKRDWKDIQNRDQDGTNASQAEAQGPGPGVSLVNSADVILSEEHD